MVASASSEKHSLQMDIPKMTSQFKLSEETPQSFITVSSDELKGIFGDNDVVRLEYPTNEFPTPKTQIIMVFSKQSGKKPQYVELQEWLDLLEEYRESQQLEQTDQTVPDMPFLGDIQAEEEHGESFVCIVSFLIDGNEDNANQIVVDSEDRNDCINAILESYPHEHLDFSIELMCKKCFQEQLLEKVEEDIDYYGGSRMIH